jgi:hypothetical protein
MQQGPQINPYAPPTHQMQQGYYGAPPGSPSEAAQRGLCPQCQSPHTSQPGFTWWGGILGPKLFNHRVCGSCGFGFNGTTGLSNRNKIIAYVVIVFSIVIVGTIASAAAN